MKRKGNPVPAMVLVIFLLAPLILGFAVPSYAATSQSTEIFITTTHPVLAFLIRLIGGDYVDVMDIIPPGVDPHGYEPSIDDIRKISSSDIIVIDSLHHLPISSKIYELYRERSVVLLDELLKAGWKPDKIPGTDVENLHEVFLDEKAFSMSIDILGKILSSVANNKGLNISSYIAARGEVVKSIISRSFDQARREINSLGISGIALYSPVSYYLVRSIGANVSTILTPDPELDPSPSSLQLLRSIPSRCLLVISDFERADIDRLRGSLGALGIRIVSIEIASNKDPEDILLAPLVLSQELGECVKTSKTASGENGAMRWSDYTSPITLAALGLALGFISGYLFRRRYGG